MAEFYPWFAFAHVVGLVVFAIAHGVSAFVAFRVRTQRDPSLVADTLELSRLAIWPMYVGLLLLAIGGLGAAWIGDLLAKPWVLGSIGVLVVVLAVMYSVATPYYMRIRRALGPDAQPPLTSDDLARMLDTRRPEVLLVVGSVGLLILVWLMVLRPG
jgi:uncharacterized membrane protein